MYLFFLWAYHLFTVNQDINEGSIALVKGDQIIVEDNIWQDILQRKGVSNTLSIHDPLFWRDEKFLAKSLRPNFVYGGDITPDRIAQDTDFLIPVKIKSADNSERNISLSITSLLKRKLLKSTIKNPYMNNAPNCNHRDINHYASELWKDEQLNQIYQNETLREEQAKCAKFLTLVGSFLDLEHLAHYCKMFFEENFNCPQYWSRSFGKKSVEEVVRSYQEKAQSNYISKNYPTSRLPGGYYPPSWQDVLNESNGDSVKTGEQSIDDTLGVGREIFPSKSSSLRSTPFLPVSIPLDNKIVDNILIGDFSQIPFPSPRGLILYTSNNLFTKDADQGDLELNSIYQQFADQCNPSEISQYVDRVNHAFSAIYNQMIAEIRTKVASGLNDKEKRKYKDFFKNFEKTVSCVKLLEEVHQNDKLDDKWIKKYCQKFVLPGFNCSSFWHKNFADASMDEIVAILGNTSNVVSNCIMRPFFDFYIHSRYVRRTLNFDDDSLQQDGPMGVKFNKERPHNDFSSEKIDNLWNSGVIVGQSIFKFYGWVKFAGSTFIMEFAR